LIPLISIFYLKIEFNNPQIYTTTQCPSLNGRHISQWSS